MKTKLIYLLILIINVFKLYRIRSIRYLVYNLNYYMIGKKGKYKNEKRL